MWSGEETMRFRNPLAHVRVASPCKADWNQMIGSDNVRFCGQCNLNVYNLSGMTRDQAESLIAANEGRLCVRFYRRRDGSIITQDCPVGLRAVQQRLAYVRKAVIAALLTFVASLGLHKLWPELLPVPPRHEVLMGAIAPNRGPEVGVPVAAMGKAD
jgi:hypothetical protein